MPLFQGGGGEFDSDESDVALWEDEEGKDFNANAKFHDDSSCDTSMYSASGINDDEELTKA